MGQKISKKQLEMLNFIKESINSKGYPPSVRELCKAVGLKSPSTVHGYLARLEAMGYIKRDPSKSRAIVLNENEAASESTSAPSTKALPVLGQVAAGTPILAVENIEGYFPLPEQFGPRDASFLLRVKGESMKNAGIFDGDFVIIRQQSMADNGDIVLALIDDSATIKTFYKEKNHFRLQPENDFMEPIIVKNLSVLGKVVGLFRNII